MSKDKIKVRLRDLEFLERSNPKSYDLTAKSDYRLIIRAVRPADITIILEGQFIRSLANYMKVDSHLYIILELYGDFFFHKRADGIKELRNKCHAFEIVFDQNDVAKYYELGEEEFLRECNVFRFKNIFSVRQKLIIDQDKIDKNEPQFKSIIKQIKILSKWIEIYSDWFLENGFEIPGIETISATGDNKTRPDIKKEWKGSKTDIVEECIRKKLRGVFKTFKESYRWASSTYTINGKSIESAELEKYLTVLEQRGTITEDDGKYFRNKWEKTYEIK